MQEKKPLNNTNAFIECSNRSSNINKIIRSVLNFFFFSEGFHKYKKAQNRLQRTRIKMCIKNI